MRSRGIEGRIQ